MDFSSFLFSFVGILRNFSWAFFFVSSSFFISLSDSSNQSEKCCFFFFHCLSSGFCYNVSESVPQRFDIGLFCNAFGVVSHYLFKICADYFVFSASAVIVDWSLSIILYSLRFYGNFGTYQVVVKFALCTSYCFAFFDI